jgi:ATP-dependent RNA helicase DDX5/DBP2
MHGDKAQKEREFVLSQFRSGRASILVATDVASRGLDIDDIQFVVNYDFPRMVEDYVHRIGRTARSDKTGTAYTFFTDQNIKLAKELISVLTEACQVVPPQLTAMAGLSHQYFADKRRGRDQRRPMREGPYRSFSGHSGAVGGSRMQRPPGNYGMSIKPAVAIPQAPYSQSSASGSSLYANGSRGISASIPLRPQRNPMEYGMSAKPAYPPMPNSLSAFPQTASNPNSQMYSNVSRGQGVITGVSNSLMHAPRNNRMWFG